MSDPKKQTADSQAIRADDTNDAGRDEDTRSLASDPSEEQLGEQLDRAFREMELDPLEETATFRPDYSGPAGQQASGQSAEDSELQSLRPTLARLKQLSNVVEEADQLSVGSKPAPADSRRRSDPKTIGKYQVREVLGQGGQASAYLALDPDLKRHVVLKVYHAVISEAQREQVLREGQLLARVQSPFVAQCFGADRSGKAPYLVVEYIRGATLAMKYAHKRPSVETALTIVRDVATGLIAVHASGLIHRDIKPANIILGDDGRPRLVDFGLASQLASEDLATISGTPRYMPPEQARGELETVDHRSDLFGLGAVLYNLLTGAAPFDAENARESLEKAKRGEVQPVDELQTDLDPQIADLCMRCLAAAPTSRPDSARELVAELDRLLASRNRPASLAKFGAIAAAAVILLALLFVWSPWRAPNTAPIAATNGTEGTTATTNNSASPTTQTAQDKFQSAARHPLDQRVLRRDFTLQVEIEGARLENGVAILREGDVISIRLKSNRECFAGVWSVEADTVVQLFPNEDDANAKILANRSRVVPDTGQSEDTQIRVTPSSGEEFIHVVASTTPLPKIEGQSFGPYVVLTTEKERGSWSSSLRGLVLESSQPKTGDPAAKAEVSEFVLPYRVVAD